MLTETLSIWRKNFFVFAGHAVLIVIFVMLAGQPVLSGSSLAIYAVVQLSLAFLVQRAVIFESTFFAGKATEGGSGLDYLAVGMGQGLITLALTMFAGMTFVGQMMSYDSPKAVLIVSFILVDFFVGKLLLGTWLPASIKGKKTDLFDALAGGWRGFQRLFSQVLAIVLVRLAVFGCAAAVLYCTSRGDGYSLSQNTMLLLAGLFALINLFLGSMVDVLFAKEVKDEVDKSSSLYASENRSGKEGEGMPDLYRWDFSDEPLDEDGAMRNAPVAAIIYELLYDMYEMMETGAGFDEWYDDEYGVPCRTFDHSFISKWEWSTGILAIVGAIRPFYPPHLRDRLPSKRSTPYYVPVMTLEQCLEADFSAFETFGHYCYAMFTFNQFVDDGFIGWNQFSPLFAENFAQKDDICLVERLNSGEFVVDWRVKRFEQKVMTYWMVNANGFKPKY